VKNQPSVSVIVPVYNAELTIRKCIDSLLELNYPKEQMELLLVDNNSNDHTREVLESYKWKIQILNEKRKGPAAARNRGIENANGEVVAFTDSDCTVDKDWLQRIVDPLKDQNIGAVGGKILAQRPCNGIEEFGEVIHDHYRAINEYKPSYVITMNWASRSSVLHEVGFFDESFARCEDVDLAFRISQAGYRFEYAPEALVYHAHEKTLSGLFQEGFLHGFYSIKTIRVHEAYMKNSGFRRFDRNSYRHLMNSWVDFLKDRNRPYSYYQIVFNSGKKLGKCLGSMRFGYFDI